MDEEKEKGTWVVVAEGPAHHDKVAWLCHSVVFAGADGSRALAVAQRAEKDDETSVGLWFCPDGAGPLFVPRLEWPR